MVLKIFLTLYLLSHSLKCSIVVDESRQKGVYISDFCPKTKYCLEGAHVMCMYYNPHSVMGPQCVNPKNVSMTPEIANKLVDVTNAIRSKIALGNEKGMNGERFPRGYGIFRLKWDTELATFAQVLANQCILRHDLCRATSKFADPGQVAGLVRFTNPGWVPISSKSKNVSKPGFSNDKLMYATTQSLKSWYGQKSSVSVQMLTNYPDWSLRPDHLTGRLYMKIIYGPATHMGCGISAYSEYAFYDNNAAMHYNAILIICNFSARPHTGVAIYNTVPPIDIDSSFNACGCPAGSIQDDDCLCHEVPKEPDPPAPTPSKPHTCQDNLNCDPTVVLLPIFTMEDAPPDKLIPPQRFHNETINQMTRANEFDSFEQLLDNHIYDNKKTVNGRSNMMSQTNPHGQYPTSQITGGTSIWYHNDNMQKNKKNYDKVFNHIQRASIFAKTPRFELPRSNEIIVSIKKDVVPRKDFTTAKRLVGKYLISKNNVMAPREKDYHYEISNVHEPKAYETPNLVNDVHVYLRPKEHKQNNFDQEEIHFHDILTTENNLSTVEKRLMNHGKYMNALNTTYDVNKKPVTDKDQKLLSLLNNLEQEVNHIELHDKDKQILDAKIKKIYGNIVHEPHLNHESVEDKNKKVKVIVIKDHDDMYDDNMVHKLEPPHDVINYNVGHYPVDLGDVELDNFEKHSNQRQRNNIRPRNQNDINSFELDRHKYGNEMNNKIFFKSNNHRKSRQKNNIGRNLKSKSYYDYWYDDPLSAERRKYYQDKLDEIERKLNVRRSSNQRKVTLISRPHMRPVRPSVKSDNQIETLYTPGRARFLHGY